MNKKGQLEIGITMMVLLVFLVLLIISLVVYFKFTAQGIRETRQDVLDEKFSTLVNAITGMPELRCSVKGTEKECLDAKKMLAFSKALKNNDALRGNYIDEFGIRNLEVNIVYPPITNPQDCTSGGLVNSCNFNLLHGNNAGQRYSTPVSVYYPDENIYKIGKLIVIAEVN